LKIKCVDSRVNVHVLDSTSVLIILRTVQVPNIALTHTKRITVREGGCVIPSPCKKPGASSKVD
jgi:hypothetical protein